MIIDCIADTHGQYPTLEGGDLLIVAGDLTARDNAREYKKFFDWLIKQKYTRKILVAGNHDNYLEKSCKGGELSLSLGKEYDENDNFIEYGYHYLCDSGTEFEGLRIWGSPWTLKFPGMNPHCMAFTCDTEEELAEKWAMIPEDTDILVTHSPPIAVLDQTVDNRFVGSVSLSAQLGFFSNLKLHVFGHIHEAYGKIDPSAYLPNYFDVCRHYSVNASHVNEQYQPVNKPIRVIL